ncbi:MAG TPA: hypothetical protein VNA88_11765 [Candidatus Kapabacteria bacterium]|jgi:hypothetical protein|nr:hypothetical protein [Candidatus Kapabacteria bacterium]
MSTEPLDQPKEFPHWNRVYAAVILFTVLTIVGLWLFSRAFTPTALQ